MSSRYVISVAYLNEPTEDESDGDSDENMCIFPTCSLGGLRYFAMEAYAKTRRITHCEVFVNPASMTAAQLQSVPPAPKTDRHQDSDYVVAFAAVSDGGVLCMRRVFQRHTYHTLSISVTREQFNHAVDFAIEQIGKKYDHKAASWRLLINPPKFTGERYWCASLTHAIVRKVGLLKYPRINTLDVPDIIRMLRMSHSADLTTARPLLERITNYAVSASLFAPTTSGGTIPAAVTQFLVDGCVATSERSSRVLLPESAGGAGAACSQSHMRP